MRWCKDLGMFEIQVFSVRADIDMCFGTRLGHDTVDRNGMFGMFDVQNYRLEYRVKYSWVVGSVSGILCCSEVGGAKDRGLCTVMKQMIFVSGQKGGDLDSLLRYSLTRQIHR